jgi:hypothetical protein
VELAPQPIATFGSARLGVGPKIQLVKILKTKRK